MGLLDRLFQKKQGPEEKKSIKEGQMEEFLEKELGSVWDGGEFDPKKAESITKRIISANKDLEKAPEKDNEVHKVLAGRSRSARKMVVSTTEREIKGLEYGSLKEFYNSTRKALKTISMNNSRYGGRAKILFSKEYSQLWEKLKELYEYYSQMKKTAKKNIRKEKKLMGWLDAIKERKETIKALELLEGQRKELKESTKILESGLEKLEQGLSKTKNSKEFEAYKQEKKALEQMRSDMEDVKEEFSALVLGVKKALLYYQHKMANSSMEKSIGQILGQRGDFIGSEHGLERTISVFSRIRGGMKSGAIRIKDKRIGKIARLMEKADHEYLEGLFRRHGEIHNSIKKQEDRIGSMPAIKKINNMKKEISEAKQDISRKKAELDNLENKLQKIGSELKAKDREISGIKKGIHDSLSVIVEK